VEFGNGVASLGETADVQSRLEQAFIVGEGGKHLAFTRQGLSLEDPADAPGDAFETALRGAFCAAGRGAHAFQAFAAKGARPEQESKRRHGKWKPSMLAEALHSCNEAFSCCLR
jgi:hypothetical protein